ncbi:MAG: P-loop NTPase [Fimbriimonadaceae bacterium]
MFKVHAKRVAITAILGLVGGLLIAGNLPKLFEARTDVLIDNSINFQNYDPTIQAILSRYNSGGVETEMSVLASKGLFEAALAQVAEQRRDPYLMRDADWLFKRFEVLQGGQDSKVVVMSAKANNAQLAADILNQITQFYNEFREKKTREAMSSGEDVLKAQVARAYGDMKRTEAKLVAFKSKYKITDPIVESARLAGYQGELTQQRDAAMSQLAAISAEVSSQRAKLQVLPRYTKISLRQTKTARVLDLEQKLAVLQTERLSALQKFQPTSQKMQEYDRLVSSLEKDLLAEKERRFEEASQDMQIDPVRAQMESGLAANEIAQRSLQAKIASANSLLGQTNSKIEDLPNRDRAYNQYMREFEIRQKQYLSYLSMQEDLKRKIDSASGSAIALFPAKAEETPVAPDVLKLGAVGLIFGIVLGVLGSFLVESLRLPVRTSGQLAELTGLPVAATIPLMPRRAASRMLAGLPDPNHKPAESFRFMAFSHLAKEGGAPKIVLFTGIGGSVGCSSAAAQFALAMAKTGVRTLLVDCDLRHPALTTSFGASDESGVSDMLNRTMLPAEGLDIAVETIHPNLKLITAGTDGMGGLADYPTSHIVGIMNHMSEKADIVVIDAPPCDIVADAARLVPYVDEVCLVVSAQATSFRSVPMAYDILKRSGAKEISMVLTHASPQDEPFSKKSSYLAAA